jgi:hypothetical protein
MSAHNKALRILSLVVLIFHIKDNHWDLYCQGCIGLISLTYMEFEWAISVPFLARLSFFKRFANLTNGNL